MGCVLLKTYNCVDNQTVTTATKGLPTGSWTRVPTTSAEVKAEINYVLYDYKYRPIRTYTTNYLGGYTNTDSKLDSFSGLLQYTLQKHKRTANNAELTVKDTFTYSPQDRLIQHTHQINGGAEQLLAENTYDELGQLISKKVGNTIATPLQKVDYSYNIRGWLTKINEIGSLQQGTDPADLFGFKINYNTVDGSTGAASPLYNGNIAETFWSTATDGGFVRNYGYKYDSLNRLKDATYQKTGGILNNYDENLTYDKNGNILSLMRMGNSDTQSIKFLIDELKYEYTSPTSNQLAKVTEGVNGNSSQGFIDGNTSGNDYAYDANGNMTVDKNKNITAITYNHLNLPTKIIFPTGNIVYFYTASGQKVQKVVTENTTVTTTDYLSGYQYKNLVLQYFPTVEGYVEPNLSSFKYVFQYKDHLGNVRLSYFQNGSSLNIISEDNYYPFGLKHDGYNITTTSVNPALKVKYNGKELQDELGLNLYDFGARNYEPALGRWMNIDPLAEKMRRYSPYNYVLNNPVYFIDPDGMWIDINDGGKTYRYNNGKYYTQNQETKKWDVEATVVAESYAGKILTSLQQIMGGDENSFGSQFLNLFSNDNINVGIKENNLTGNNKGINGTTKDGKTILTSFSQDVTLNTTSGNEKSPFYVTLFHEIGHSFSSQVFNDAVTDDVWVSKSELNGLPKDISNDEVYASTVENFLRSEQGLPLRTHYANSIDGSSVSETKLIERGSKTPFSTQYQLTPTTRGILNKIINSKK